MVLHSPRFASNARLNRASENSPAMNWGEVGEAVRLVQQALIDTGYRMPISTRKHGSPDGIFGNETKARVRSFQARYGLAQDGIAGRNTLARLDRLFPSAGNPLPALPPDSWVTHRFRVVFRSIATPVVPEFTALANARAVYGLYGFRIDEGPHMSLWLDPNEQLTLNVIDGACRWDQENDEQRVLFAAGGGRAGLNVTDILVYYVNRIRRPNGRGLNGCAGHRPGAPAVVVAATGSPWTMAHEAGHVLLGSGFSPVHHDKATNLMFSPSASITANPPGLIERQVRAMRLSAFCMRV